MRIVHRAGKKAFVDYSGKKPRLWDRGTGEAREVELFAMVLGASNYTYAETTLTQRLPDFVGSTIRGFEFFNGVPEVLVPDQLRSAVRGPRSVRAGHQRDVPGNGAALRGGGDPGTAAKTFNDLMRTAQAEALVTRSISGHLTERMQEHYSTVSGAEQRARIAKVIDLMTPRKREHAA
jgi:hypothetical protein